MKKIILILFILFSFNANSFCSISKDTTQIKTMQVDTKKIFVNELSSCFSNTKFDNLVKFCESDVSFTVFVGDNSKTEQVTDYKAIDLIDDIFRNFRYTRFKILGGKNDDGDDMIVVIAFQYADCDKSSINVSFILDKSNSVKAIAIY